MRIKNPFFTLLAAALILFPGLAFAGPIYSGIDCLLLILAVILIWMVQVGIYVVPVFLILLLLFFTVLKLESKWWMWPLLIIVSIVFAQFGSMGIRMQIANINYQESQEAQARSLSFILYEPSYTVPGFDLVESTVELLKISRLEYNYRDRITKGNRESVDANRYTVICQELSDVMHNSSISGPLLVSKNIGKTAISVFGRIPESEAQKVLASMQQVKASDIQFHSDIKFHFGQ
jgi:hypothetical protein